MTKTAPPEHDLITAAREMVAHAKGELTLSARKVRVPEGVDVVEIRKGLGLNQREFAEHFGFALSAVKEWEQGRRQPERATRIFLTVIKNNPQAVEQALAAL